MRLEFFKLFLTAEIFFKIPFKIFFKNPKLFLNILIFFKVHLKKFFFNKN